MRVACRVPPVTSKYFLWAHSSCVTEIVVWPTLLVTCQYSAFSSQETADSAKYE